VKGRDQVIAELQQHPNRIEELLKPWIYCLNKIGIGVKHSQLRHTLTFTRDVFEISIPISHLLQASMYQIIKMFDPVKATLMGPHNDIDGIAGWQHPDTVKDQREVAIEKAERMRLRGKAASPFR
jgi:hypothetical protein